MQDMIIRNAEVEDAIVLAGLDKLCFSEPWSYESFKKEIIENDLAIYIVAEIGKQIVGYAGIWLIMDEGHITNVAVIPEFRRKGIAKALIEVLINICESENIIAETLEVRASNEPAKNLYAQYGFKEAGIRKGYYEDNHEDAIIMWRGSE